MFEKSTVNHVEISDIGDLKCKITKWIVNDSFILSRFHQRGVTVIERFVFLAKPLARVAQ